MPPEHQTGLAPKNKKCMYIYIYINQIINESEGIITDNSAIQMALRNNYEQR